MKRIFNHTKKPIDNWEGYDESDFTWDMSEEYEPIEEGEYEKGSVEDDELVYSDDAGEYESVEFEADMYYEEEYTGDEHTEEEYGEEEGYYAEDEYYEEDEYYAEDEYYEEDEYYAEDEYYKEETFIEKFRKKFLNMPEMDRVITVTGVIVLVLALITGSLYINRAAQEKAISTLATVGNQLEGIELIGEKGLLAVADAHQARLAAAEIVEEEEDRIEYNENEYSDSVTVKLNMTSVKKDLKLKFTNKKTGKLISNVPFSVTVTDPDGKSSTWSDDDMDGIIYKKNIQPGEYSVLINELAGEKYKDYSIPTAAETVEVKKDIKYEKIDVSDEVKTEDEIDVSKEDTKINETEVESTLKDTVAWVESTTIAETYKEVAKSTVPDPFTLVASQNVMRMSQLPQVSGGDVPVLENQPFTASINPTELMVAVGQAATAQVAIANATAGVPLSYHVESQNTGIVTAGISETGQLTLNGVAPGTATVTVRVDYAQGASYPVNVSLTVTVPAAASIALDKTTVTSYVAQPFTLQAAVTNGVSGVVSAETSNGNVATVAVNGNTVTVTPVAEGEATVIVKYTEGAQVVQASCAVTVKLHPKDNRTMKLKDTAGVQLYVWENGTYREAVYADYYTFDKFFVKGEVKYTGWQTIDGKVYYFTANGEKVTGEQVIQGAKYNFASDGSLVTGSGTMGIDVSKWNGKIDWKAVKNSGVSYVIIRCGYRGSSQGSLIEDPQFTTNIKGATAAGLKVGVYFFTQATDEIEAVEEASYVLDKIKKYKISYPVFLDVEPSGGRGDKIDKATRTAVCKAFCETIQRAGYTAGIYANKTWLNQKMDASQLNAYKIWLAQYAASPTYSGKYDMWQYTSKGKVSGINGDVDLNVSYLGY